MARPRIALPEATSSDLEYNRQCMPAYLEAIHLSGGIAVVIPLSMPRSHSAALMTDCDGVLLPGSPADVQPLRFGQARLPATALPDLSREEIDWRLLDDAEEKGKPVLGICYGLQSINVWRGGTLLQDLSVMPVNHAAGPSVAVAHTAALLAGSSLSRLGGSREASTRPGAARLPVNSSHHQAVGILGEGLRVSARCPEDGIVEALESVQGSEPSLIAVQWHPERSFGGSATSRRIFGWLVEEAAKWRG